jgi:hypothetical protein
MKKTMTATTASTMYVAGPLDAAGSVLSLEDMETAPADEMKLACRQVRLRHKKVMPYQTGITL